MMNKKDIKLVSEVLMQALTSTFMASPPEEWQEPKDTAIEIRLPLPPGVIDAIQQLKEKMKDFALDLDFNLLLSLFISDLVFRGLVVVANHDTKSKEEIADMILTRIKENKKENVNVR